MSINYDFEIIKSKFPEIKQELKSTISNQQVYNNFIKTITLYSLKENTLYLLVNNEFIKKTLEYNYLKLIQSVINKILLANFNIKLITKNETIDTTEASKLTTNTQNKPKEVKQEVKQIEKESVLFEPNTNTNPKYTFENLIISNFNKSAYTAIKSIFDKKLWNPIFINGGVGLGKTHLLHAAGNEFIKYNPNAKVLYVTSDTFIREVYNALASNNHLEIENLKNKYQSCDLLLFDDIQFLSKKEKINEIFFNIFNNNITKDLFIIMTSDKRPEELENFESRMQSRFSSGLTVEINKPSLDSIVNILENKISSLNEGYIFNKEAINYIARRNQNDIRKLEGFLHQIIFYAINNLAPNSIITVDVVENATKTSANQEIKEFGYDVDPNIVIENICIAYGVDPKSVKSKLRKKEIVNTRNVCIYVLRKKFNMPYEQIGKFFANRNHSTIIDSYNKINSMIEKDSNLKSFIEKIYKNI